MTGKRTRKERKEEGVIIGIWGHSGERGEGFTTGAEKRPRIASRSQLSCQEMPMHGLILLHPSDLLPGLSTDHPNRSLKANEPIDIVR